MDAKLVKTADLQFVKFNRCGRCAGEATNGKKTCVSCLTKVNKYMSERHVALKAIDMCTRCGHKPKASLSTNTCKKCSSYELTKNKTRAKGLIDNNLCRICKTATVSGRTLCADHLNKKAADSRLRTLQYRKLIVEHYGGQCACENCPNRKCDGMFLSLDHINNDGNTQRKENRIGSGYQFYKWVIKNKYPTDLQLLCHNCNMAKYINNGVCPHNVPNKG